MIKRIHRLLSASEEAKRGRKTVDCLGWFGCPCFQTLLPKEGVQEIHTCICICAVKKPMSANKTQGVACPFPHLQVGWFLVSQHSTPCTPKCVRNTRTSLLKSQSQVVFKSHSGRASADEWALALGSSRDIGRSSSRRAASPAPSRGRPAPRCRGSALCLYSTWHNTMTVRFAGCWVILWY